MGYGTQTLCPVMIIFTLITRVSLSLFGRDKCGAGDVVGAIWQFMNIEALLMMIVWKILSGARVKIIMSKWHCQMILT